MKKKLNSWVLLCDTNCFDIVLTSVLSFILFLDKIARNFHFSQKKSSLKTTFPDISPDPISIS